MKPSNPPQVPPLTGPPLTPATATTWLFNFILAFTLPKLLVAFKPQGTFAYYATWNLFGWMLVLLFVPETKGKTLEELDQVFGVPTRVHAAYGLRQVPYFIGRYLLRRPLKPERLFSTDKVVYRGDSFMRELQSEPEKRV